MGFSENVRFEGYLRPDSSVTADLRTQEKMLRTGGRDATGGREKSKVLQEVLADLKIFLFDRKYAGSYTTNAERAKYF